MIWSVSTAKMFDRCQRQWFFKTQLANAIARHPERQLAYRLSKLQSISGWRGAVVDGVLSEEVLPSLERKRSINPKEVIRSAMRRFDRQLVYGMAHRLHEPQLKLGEEGDDFVAFHSMEYAGALSDAEVEQARDEVKRALTTFFEMDNLVSRLRGADRLMTQRALAFDHSDVTVRAVPDVIVFKGANPPAIVDWKVHIFGRHDAWLQLAVYAAALVRCSSHKDFPIDTSKFLETDIGLLEVQLLTGALRRHRLSDEQVQQADAYIAQSSERMLLAVDGLNGKAAELPVTDFPATRFASVCERCAFKRMCWETVQ
jgi:hypothetical protein